jgi:beta-glucosidase
MYTQFKAVANEVYQKGLQAANAPTSGPLGRTPWGGRLVESFGQDPYLNETAFGLSTRGFSEAGVLPGGKHFLLNEQETNRGNLKVGNSNSSIAPYSSATDYKTLQEVYLWPFYDGVTNGMSAVMCAMNKINGTQSCRLVRK